jgi:aminopeptidase YwaD
LNDPQRRDPDELHLTESRLAALCAQDGGRSVGSAGNRAATDAAAAALEAAGFSVECRPFPCLAWTDGGASLHVGDEPCPVLVSPFSPECCATAPLTCAASLEELASLDAAGTILLLRGELTREQLMPKFFPFYQSESHQRLIAMLEAKAPLAIIAATGRDPALAGGPSPFPLFDDGDFHVPSVYMTERDGERLASTAASSVELAIHSQRSASQACNIVGSRAGVNPRLAFLAHVDSKPGSPGALDNASGVVTLLLLADLLQRETLRRGVEIVFINGEDYYSNPGEMRYLSDMQDAWADLLLGVNLDGVGLINESTEYSMYACPEPITAATQLRFREMEGALHGAPWFQGDHALFLQHAVPALAITSGSMGRDVREIIHTAEDLPALVACHRLVDLAHTLAGLVKDLDRA